ncbi:hypothetical protein ACQP1G_25960 [Nocardia sp. CA-107356]|uniref:hypothetical protein n=1 Tax=Nocardia sp. CA-107356 TaxID=3239972 RepID=UPI003D8D890C
MKQTLEWTRPQFRTADQADRWTWLILAAYTQLRLSRGLTTDLRDPWEKPVTDPTGSPRPASGGGFATSTRKPSSPPVNGQ